MKRLWGWAAFALLAAGCRAEEVGRLADVALIDRDTGLALPITTFHGDYWVAGKPGARYSIRIASRATGRLLAVTSVDGVNVLSGATAAWNQTGYVFESSQQYDIAGWRKTDQQVAAFLFTASPNSYAQLTNRPANVGIIGIALFLERPPETARQDDLLSGGMPESRNRAEAAASAPAPRLGTGHGEREYSYVSHTEFVRQQPQPNEIIRIRYDSRENLIAMGIIHAPRRVPQNANPFPESVGSNYVPDPPG